MALVFLADDVKHGRKVAVKVLRPELAAQVGPGRFLSEIAISASLAHPNIIPLLDSGEAAGALYYVMPLIEGDSVRDRLMRDGPLPVDEALHIARGVAAALDYAHGRGILHRDIKPENVLLVAGEPVVADFGIAKALAASESGSATAVGFIAGTPAYMSPEQACGDAGLDGRSDIYSLGCLLFEMLTGELPFGGPTAMAITASKLTDATPRVSGLRRAVPPDIDAVVMRALSRKPDDRYATARDLAQALDAVRAAPGASVASPADGRPTSLAVLPFVNVGAGADDEFLADGITEALIHTLSGMPGVRVVARTSAFAFKGRTRDVREIAAQLEVSAVLEGSVRRSGKRLRVTAQLVDATDGCHRWSERYDREVDDVFALEDDIARRVAEALTVTLTGTTAERPARVTGNFAAYELYLRGRHAWNRRTEPELRRSLRYYREALAADPAFARALAGMADSYLTLGIYGLASPGEVMPAAQDAAERALALDAGSAEARTSLACVRAVYGWDWGGAESEFRRAIEAGPGYPTARHWYAMHCLAPQGRLTEARAELEAARANDPLSPTINVSLALVSLFERDTARAEREVGQVIELDPAFGFAHYVLGQVCESQGRHAAAVATFQAARPLLNESAELLAGLARALARAGDPAAAGELFEQLRSSGTTRYVSPVLTAQVLLALGRQSEGLAALAEALEVRACDLMWLRMQSAFDELRDDPRFQVIERQVGLRDA
jgi:serine/threonine-protein kinase